MTIKKDFEKERGVRRGVDSVGMKKELDKQKK